MTESTSPECRAILAGISAYLDGDLDATALRRDRAALPDLRAVCGRRERTAGDRRLVQAGGICSVTRVRPTAGARQRAATARPGRGQRLNR